jgi:2-oxoglutarate ferredoxin oxidoreductase subunit delta
MIYFGNLKAKKGNIHIHKERCKGCGFCVEYCPKNVLELSEEFNKKGYHPPRVVREEDCIYCQLCESICPEFALFVTLKKEEGEGEESESRP